MKIWNKIFHVMDAAAKAICGVCSFGFFAIIIFQVLARRLQISCNWTDEASRYLFIVMVYVGSILCVNENGHFSIDMAETLLPQKVRQVLRFVVHAISIAFLAAMGWSGVILMGRVGGQSSTYLHIPMDRLYMIFPITAALMIVYTIRVAIGDYLRIFKGQGAPAKERDEQ